MGKRKKKKKATFEGFVCLFSKFLAFKCECAPSSLYLAAR